MLVLAKNLAVVFVSGVVVVDINAVIFLLFDVAKPVLKICVIFGDNDIVMATVDV